MLATQHIRASLRVLTRLRPSSSVSSTSSPLIFHHHPCRQLPLKSLIPSSASSLLSASSSRTIMVSTRLQDSQDSSKKRKTQHQDDTDGKQQDQDTDMKSSPETENGKGNQKNVSKQDEKKDDKKEEKEDDKEEVHYSQRPPYVREKGDTRPAKYHGGCHCGDVRFQLYEDPKDAHFCHCDVCQKLHGAPVHWSSIQPKTDVFFETGTNSLAFYRTTDKSNEYKLPVKISCSHCHGAICDEGNNMMLMYPSLIDFKAHKDREPFTPRRHVFYKFRAMDVHDGQEKYEGMQFESPLMDEGDHHGSEGITGAGSRKDRDPNEKDGKHRSDNPK